MEKGKEITESKYVDVYTSIDKDVWETCEKEIMDLSIDGIQYHDNSEMTLEEHGDYQINIRIERVDLNKLKEYTICIQEYSV